MSFHPGLRAALGVAVLTFGVACESPPPPLLDGGGGGADGGSVGCAADEDCDDGLFCNGIETCAGTCVVGAPPCDASVECSEVLRMCRPACEVEDDVDGDGHSSTACGGDDCDDGDPRRYPGNPEVCDELAHDEDCDPATLGERDRDGDGFDDAACCNEVGGERRCASDCNDQRREVHPGQAETCNAIDDDCDGMADEGTLRAGYVDADFDLHGDASAPIESCADAPGFSLLADDCDDTNPVRHRAQVEICDGVDNDCDGLVDESPASIPWYRDGDDDGFGDPQSFVVSCTPVPGHAPRARDCDDSSAQVNPAAAERCNGIDDDCNGRADYRISARDYEDDDGDGVADMTCGGADCDDAVGTTAPDAPETCNGIDDDCDGVADGATTSAAWYLDRDGDGFGDSTGAPLMVCEPPPARVSRGGDCDDGSAAIRPGAGDPCDGVDQDCDGEVDEDGARVPYFVDADGDGYGSLDVMAAQLSCRPVAGHVVTTGDCGDGDALRFPGAPERCNAIDDDCDGVVDETPDRLFYVDLDGDGRGAGEGVVACDAPAGRVAFGDDCDDGDALRAPSIPERCNGRDDDCDGSVDEMGAMLCAAPYAVGACSAGACSSTCMAGRSDCDGLPETGCETDIARSRFHCGGCGVQCSPGDGCGGTTAGTCDRSPIVSVHAAERRVFVLRANGNLVAWGDNANGALGVGGVADRDAPAPVLFAAGITRVVPGPQGVSFAITSSGRVLGWGADTQRLLGFRSEVPRELAGLEGVADACIGVQHACALLADRTVRCWGANQYRQTGAASAGVVATPFDPGLADVSGLTCGSFHTCALRAPATGPAEVLCWGNNGIGQLGRGTSADGSHPNPVRVIGLPPNVTTLSRGAADATCARDGDGRLLCWGYNFNSWVIPLGSGAAAIQDVAVPITGFTDVIDVTMGVIAGCARRRVGAAQELHCWGVQGTTVSWFGHGPNTVRFTPEQVGTAADPWRDVQSYAMTDRGLCALRADGRVHCMGEDGRGQLGNGPPLMGSELPVVVPGLP